MKTTRNSPRARKERAVAHRMKRVSHVIARQRRCQLPIRTIRQQSRLRAYCMIRLIKLEVLGFLTKEGFAAWAAM